MKHYSEADLLETYYMQPGQSMPVMMHLADCSECAARYTRLERKLREAAACDAEMPETFWARQRLSIMRKIATRPMQLTRAGRALGIAAAAALAFMLGGLVMYNTIDPEPVVVATQTVSAQTQAALPLPVEEMQVVNDPWQSDELQDLRGVVAWESWVDPKNGDSSL